MLCFEARAVCTIKMGSVLLQTDYLASGWGWGGGEGAIFPWEKLFFLFLAKQVTFSKLT